MPGRNPRPKKDLPAWTKKTPDVVTVNPGPSTKKNFMHTAPKGQNNFVKKGSGKSSVELGSVSTVFNFNMSKRKKIQ